MKVCGLILLFSSLALTKNVPPEMVDIWNSLVDPFVGSCASEFNIDNEIARNFFRLGQLPNDRPFHCFLRCLYENLHFLTPQGDFDYDMVVTKAHYMPPHLAEKCISETKAIMDICGKSYVGAKCAIDSLV
ncbi:hypothetical protein PPYR_09995 [Photinus pyralis]|uniref:Uncharacterized protein n=1 Tax=Photinus pyralis TaxID=7054 RepID=A0A1Y1MBL9_PHOPY|nr:uncharacterized protein LOC116173881 [Photinus pyralis]KAB0795934.1 hypothetical protein PPYR_09995 [Photinus pyralis]